MRIIIYGIVLLIIYGLLNSIADTRVRKNQEECLLSVGKDLQGLGFTKSMLSCVKEKNGLLEYVFTDSAYPAFKSFPNVPKRYVGVWDSNQPNCNYKISLNQDSTFLAEAIKCDLTSGNFKGQWSIHDGSMIWVPERGRIRPPDINAIEHKNKNEFLLTELSGKKTQFTRFNTGEDRKLTVNESREKRLADFKDAQAKEIEQKKQAILNQVFPIAQQDNNLPPMLPSGWPLSIDGSGQTLWISSDRVYGGFNGERLYHVLEWDPATGERKRLNLEPSYIPSKAIPTDEGYFFWQSNPFIHPARTVKKELADAGNISLLTKGDKHLSAQLKVARFYPELVTLSDQSILLVGGYTSRKRGKKVQINDVERVSLVDGQLQVEQLADIPGEIRRGYSIVALPNQRAMLLGGTSGPYIGCSPCIADTYIFDLKSRQWQRGPDMLEPRADTDARLMPDGRVMVSGGWTPSQEWQAGASRTTEWWNEKENRFTSGKPMVAASAMHQSMWLPEYEQQILLLASGNSAHVQGYMINEDRWIALGDGFRGFKKGGTKFSTPVSYKNKQYLWSGRFSGCAKNDLGHCLIKLRLPFEPEINDPSEIKYHRNGISFLPPEGDEPAWVLGGGSFLSHRNPHLTAVDKLWLDGKIESSIPFNHARSYAQLIRMGNGFIVLAGGRGEKCREPNRSCASLPIEYLNNNKESNSANWKILASRFSHKNQFTSYLNNSILMIEPYGQVVQLQLSKLTDNTLSLAISNVMAEMNNSRVFSESEKIAIKGLSDGRIIVAGGTEQRAKIALLKPETLESNLKDEYVGIGRYLPSIYYETYLPEKSAWIKSAPSSGEGSVATIFDDGRVVKIGGIYSAQQSLSFYEERIAEKYIIEISSADGTSWKKLPLPAVVLSGWVKLITQQEELFVIGHFNTAENKHGEMMVQWFNSVTEKWETLWMADKSKRGRHQTGLIITRKLDNGKQLMFPVEVQ